MAGELEEGAEDERIVELEAIKAIYPELTIDSSDRLSALIDIEVEPLQPLPVRFLNPIDGVSPPALTTSISTLSVGNVETPKRNEHPAAGVPERTTHYLAYLPPLRLKFSLPEGYPSQAPPRVSLSCPWIPQTKLDTIGDTCTELWERIGQEQVLFLYIDDLREAAERAFDLVSGDGAQLYVPADLEVSLLDHECKTKRMKFEQQTFECGICLEPKKGSVCHRLVLCSHVFCVECLQDFYNACIAEGDVGKIRCTAPRCGEEEQQARNEERITPSKRRRKTDRTLEPSELLQIPLEQQVVQRYIKMKRKKMLESSKKTVYCPRQWCQGPARSSGNPRHENPQEEELESDPDETTSESYDPNTPEKFPPPAERLAICEDCSFAFCKVCKASWHGEYFSCFPRSKFELTAEERASEDYMKLHTQPCPTCDARAQKTYGCNHMICAQCDTHFCYLCGAYLVRDNPYGHFNTVSQACYMRLWELEAGDGAEVGQGFAGGIPEVVHVLEEDNPPVVDAAPEGRDVAPEPAQEDPAERPVARNRRPERPNENVGLQRFLRLVQDDEEDEWDSDEMDDDADELGDRWVG